MKRIIVICLLALTAVYGCQVNELVEVDPESKSFTASIEDNCTKTSLDDQGNVLFKQGDQMSIFVGSTINEQYQVTDDSDGKTSASLIKVTGPGFVAGGEIDNNIAFYPYASAITIAKNGSAFVLSGITLPSTQNYAEGSFGNGAFPMAAVTSSAEDMHLKFKNVLGGVKLQLTGTAVVKSVSISGNSNEILCGAAEVTVSNTSTPTISLTDASAKTVTLDCGDGVQLNSETATSFIIALPPMTMEGGFTVVVTDTEGKQMEVSTSRPQAITRSNLLKMPVVSFTGSTPIEEHNYTLSIYTPTTKTSLSDNLMTWVAGDKVFLSDGVSSEVCTIPDNYNGSTTAVVTTHQAFDGEVYCIYPGDAVTQDGDDFYVDIPENQNTDGSAFMVLSGNATSDNITLFLRTALMKVSFLSNIEDVAFTSITVEGAPLVGRLKIDELGANVVSGTNTVQVSSDGDNDFYFSVFPGSITGLSVEVYKTDNTYGCKTFSPSVTFEAGRMYSLPINPSTIDFRSKPLTITSSGTTSVSISAVGAPDAITLDYKKGASGWTSYTIGNSIDLTDGESLQLRAGAGGNASFSKSFNDYYKFSITGSGTVAASGSIMFLLDQEESITIPSSYCFSRMFEGCTSLTSAPDLPATTLADHCYSMMFWDCTSMTAAPELPATTLATYCYSTMFNGCTSMTAAPELPATTMANFCYCRMFEGCTNLTAAPELPATTLARNCYSAMFSGCTNLTAAPELPATTLADYCYDNMFNGCTGLTAAPDLPATTLADHCYSTMFSGCTNLTAAPELPATTLAAWCYSTMFNGCTGLTTAPELPATTLAPHCYSSMFIGCTNLTAAPELPATSLARNCYLYMFTGCTNLTAAPELPATTLAAWCYFGMFRGCTNLTAAPELPATTLAEYCYNDMFYGCSQLNYIKCLATDLSATACLSNWVDGVSPSGVFIKNPDTTWPTGTSGIPEGWTVYPTGLPSNAEAVDLDLPSGLKWATLNVGAYSIEESGNYYAWGETEPKDNYSWGTYKFELGTDFTGPFSKYVTRPNYGTVDNKTVLDPEDDAAQVNWGGNWRMPTDADWVELMDNCTWTWTTDTGTDNGTYGMRVTSNTNGNSIFLPAAGSRLGDELSNGGSYGYYWSSTLSQVGSDLPWYVYFGASGAGREHYGRHLGRSVRPVCE